MNLDILAYYLSVLQDVIKLACKMYGALPDFIILKFHKCLRNNDDLISGENVSDENRGVQCNSPHLHIISKAT